MKKVFYLVAVATLALLSCQQQELDPIQDEVKNEGFTFKASIEQLADGTKGTINSENALVWSASDQIGIYVNDNNWTDKNQPFTLSSGAGSTQGEFTWDYSGTFSDKAAAAFYPWEGTGSDKNNVYDGTMYFKLRDSYWSYVSGKMLTPLVASLSGSTDPISFKHAGAAVKVTINNLPANTHSIGMSVNGRQITGDYSINPANAGTDALALLGEPDNTKNTIWLNYTNSTESAWTFVFPVPELTAPKLSFQIYDENNVKVWSKKLKAQSSDLGRGDLLVMPPIDITPYEKFNSLSTDWCVRGNLVGNDWTNDVPVLTDGSGFYIAKNMSFPANGSFKIKHFGDSWDDSWPSGNYAINNTSAETYDVVFKYVNAGQKEVLAVIPSSESPYPGNVTLYVHPNTPVQNELCFKSSTLGTAAWPGTPFSSYEIVAGSKYYKMAFSAPMLWGKTINDLYVIDRDNWVAKDGGCTLTFPSGKTEYFINATKNEDLVLLSGRPSEPSISINGVFTDWESIAGNSTTNSKENTVLMKAYSDGNNLYVYMKLTVKDGYPVDLSSGRYFRLFFDKDNLSSTGASEWYRKGAETIPTGIDSFLVYFNHSGSVDNADIQGIGDNYEIKVINNSNASLELELKVPRSVLGRLTADGAESSVPDGDEIIIYCLGYRGGDYSEFTGSVGGVMFPAAS